VRLTTGITSASTMPGGGCFTLITFCRSHR